MPMCKDHNVIMWHSWSSNTWQCDVCWDDWTELLTGIRQYNTPRMETANADV